MPPSLEDLASQLVHNLATSLNEIVGGMPPAQGSLFRLPPVGVWVYKIECRVWQKFSSTLGAPERWSDWFSFHNRPLLAWYSRKKDAEKALERWLVGRDWMRSAGREFRVTPVWYEHRPHRRDLDRKRRSTE